MSLIGSRQSFVESRRGDGDGGVIAQSLGDVVVGQGRMVVVGVVAEGGGVGEDLARRDRTGKHEIIGDDDDIFSRIAIDGAQAVAVICSASSILVIAGEFDACAEKAGDIVYWVSIAVSKGNYATVAVSNGKIGDIGGIVPRWQLIPEGYVEGRVMTGILHHHGKGDHVAGVDGGEIGIDVVCRQPGAGHLAAVGSETESAGSRLGKVGIDVGVGGEGAVGVASILDLDNALGDIEFRLAEDDLNDVVVARTGERRASLGCRDLIGQVETIGKGSV